MKKEVKEWLESPFCPLLDEDEMAGRCKLNCKTEEDCPSINSYFCGGCEQCAYFEEKFKVGENGSNKIN